VTRVDVLTALDPLRFKLNGSPEYHSHLFIPAARVFRGARVMVAANRLIDLDEMLLDVGEGGLTLLPVAIYQGHLVVAYRASEVGLLKVDPSRFVAREIEPGFG